MQKQKGISTLVGIIIIIAVAIVAFGGVIAYLNWQKNKTTPNDAWSPTAGWKTYTNTEYGFEFKYPDNLYAITMFYSSKNVSVCDTNDEAGSFDQSCYFGLDYYDNLYNLVGGQADKSGSQVSTVLEYINARDWSGVTKENLLEAHGYCGTHSLPNEKIVKECIFEYNGHIFYIPKPDTEIGKQIISTFKFTK